MSYCGEGLSVNRKRQVSKESDLHFWHNRLEQQKPIRAGRGEKKKQ
jgi:hypothetical protein